ncbi:MAG: energy transducer TonB [Pseudoxanthomonas sp.]
MRGKSHAPRSQQASDSHLVFRLPRSALRIAGIAAGIGLLLFALVWWMGRDDGFYTAEPTAQTGESSIEALPAPLPGDDSASGMEEPRPQASEGETTPLEEIPPPVAIDETPPASEPAATPVPIAAPAPAAPVATTGNASLPTPIAAQSPSPQYPSSAMRRGDTGTVLLRVAVDASGKATDVDFVQRSGSRALDRAAQEAVSQWRFTPAQRDGQPVAASVDIPISFDLRR